MQDRASSLVLTGVKTRATLASLGLGKVRISVLPIFREHNLMF